MTIRFRIAALSQAPNLNWRTPSEPEIAEKAQLGANSWFPQGRKTLGLCGEPEPSALPAHFSGS
jgi:hypothetical protein